MRSLAIAILIIGAPGLVQAQAYRGSSDRSDTWEWSVAAIYQGSESAGGGGGSALEMDSAWGLGFNIGYNFSNRLALGGELEWLAPDYKATLVSESDPADSLVIDHHFSQFNFRFKGIFNFMEGPFTPYLEAGLGWTYMDSNVADGPPITGCWWTWYGYVCSNYYSTYSETPFTYGGALGLRYRLQGGTLLKLSYNNYRLDNSGDSADPTLAAWRFELAWGF